MTNKDILVGVLVAYVAYDWLLAFILTRRYPNILGKFMDLFTQPRTWGAFLVAVLVGWIAYRYSLRLR